MKPIVYFFGLISGNFVSFPNDHTADIFKTAFKKVKNESQIILHRKDNLLYYCYLRRIDNKSFFGISLCLDCIYTDLNRLFGAFDNIFADAVEKGDLLMMDERGRLAWTSPDFSSNAVAINEYSKNLIDKITISKKSTIELPPVDFSISINDCIELSLENGKVEILDATKRYCNVYIAKTNSEIERVTSFNNLLHFKDGIIEKIGNDLKAEQKRCSELKSANLKLKAKQKSIVWVSIFGIISAIMFVILYFKVINPSEVTHYETGEFIYYGPLKNKKPNGIGVAVYPVGDKDGRKYYIGNFTEGERQDTAAILFYQDGDYFYGAMEGDNWKEGLFYRRSDGTYFQGTFENNQPYDGEWYDHVRKHSSVKGEVIY